MLGSLKETVVTFGKTCSLTGVLSQSAQFSAQRPAVILLNSGVMHHVGTCNLSTYLARAVVNTGCLALRIDFSGVGDSEERQDEMPFEESSVIEVKETMDFLSKSYGVKRFVLYGLCSGADASFNTALNDERVIAIAQIDPYSYSTWRYQINYYLPKFFSARRWRNYILRRLGLNGATLQREGHEIAGIAEGFFESPAYTRDFPQRSSVEQGVKRLLARNIEILNIYAGKDIYNYKTQFFDMFNISKKEKKCTVFYFPNASHVISEPHDQAQAVQVIMNWIKAL